jgi:hypothetical protein
VAEVPSPSIRYVREDQYPPFTQKEVVMDQAMQKIVDQRVEELTQQIRAAKNEIAVLLTPRGSYWDPQIQEYREDPWYGTPWSRTSLPTLYAWDYKSEHGHSDPLAAR